MFPHGRGLTEQTGRASSGNWQRQQTFIPETTNHRLLPAVCLTWLEFTPVTESANALLPTDSVTDMHYHTPPPRNGSPREGRYPIAWSPFQLSGQRWRYVLTEPDHWRHRPVGQEVRDCDLWPDAERLPPHLNSRRPVLDSVTTARLTRDSCWSVAVSVCAIDCTA